MNRAYVESLLVGVPLPADKGTLVRYAEEQGAGEEALAPLRDLPDRRYRGLNEVGEALWPVAPPASESDRKVPRPESGDVPGGDEYASARGR